MVVFCRAVLLLGIASVLSGCNGIVGEAKKAAASQTRDPEAVRFGEIQTFKTKDKSGREVTAVCGSLNAKNGFGAYVGMTPFVYIKGTDSQSIEISPNPTTERFTLLWNDVCFEKKSGYNQRAVSLRIHEEHLQRQIESGDLSYACYTVAGALLNIQRSQGELERYTSIWKKREKLYCKS